MGWQTRIARNYGADLLGKAMLRLDAMLDENGADKRTQLNAIQTVLKMNQIDGTEPEQDDNSLKVLKEIRRMNQLSTDNIRITGLPGEKPKAVNSPDLKFMK